MNTFKRFAFRFYQNIIALTTRILRFGEPMKIIGEHSLDSIAGVFDDHDIEKVFIVTDKGLEKAGIIDTVTTILKKADIPYVIYDQVRPNPTIDIIEQGVTLYNLEKAQGLLAVGGGSPIDTAKLIGARLASPNIPLHKMRGLLKVKHSTPFFLAVPTTAGTGSETTVAAVVRDSDSHEKYAINDPHLLPDVAVLDPVLTYALPKTITATTGMDALTHAIEAYLNKHHTKKTKQRALQAIKSVFDYLPVVYDEPTNKEARLNMLEASYDAGYAFTRDFIGNVHAISHQLSAAYDMPHGLMNAIILPLVLDYYGSSIYKKMTEIYDYVFETNHERTDQEKCEFLIDRIRSLNRKLDIPKTIENIRVVDINRLAKQAYHEANPLYPVPVMFDLIDFVTIYMRLNPTYQHKK